MLDGIGPRAREPGVGGRHISYSSQDLLLDLVIVKDWVLRERSGLSPHSHTQEPYILTHRTQRSA